MSKRDRMRDLKIAMCYNMGMLVKQIAYQYGISNVRVCQILDRLRKEDPSLCPPHRSKSRIERSPSTSSRGT